MVVKPSHVNAAGPRSARRRVVRARRPPGRRAATPARTWRRRRGRSARREQHGRAERGERAPTALVFREAASASRAQLDGHGDRGHDGEYYTSRPAAHRRPSLHRGTDDSDAGLANLGRPSSRGTKRRCACGPPSTRADRGDAAVAPPTTARETMKALSARPHRCARVPGRGGSGPRYTARKCARPTAEARSERAPRDARGCPAAPECVGCHEREGALIVRVARPRPTRRLPGSTFIVDPRPDRARRR